MVKKSICALGGKALDAVGMALVSPDRERGLCLMIRQRHDPADPDYMALTDLVPEAFRLADHLAKQATERTARSGLEVQCRKGCGVCCRYLVRISVPEALFLAGRIQETPQPRQGDLLARFGRVREVLQQEWLYEDLRGGLTSAQVDITYPHRLYLFSRRYLELGLPCPFLEDDACSIYPDRPTTCRRYLVTSPPSRCVNPFMENANRVPLDLDVPDLIAEVTSELLGEPPKLLVLSLAPEWAAQNEALARRRWRREELIGRLREKATRGFL
ncbi:MAG: YkgJ family cysteine cluster protein [Nitrospirota bacterium]